jgi:hypothetical protein
MSTLHKWLKDLLLAGDSEVILEGFEPDSNIQIQVSDEMQL